MCNSRNMNSSDIKKDCSVSSSVLSHVPNKTVKQTQQNVLDYSQYEISEEDFYPPDDKRILKSGVNDIMNGDNFEDYTEYFFGLCEEEEMYESIS